MKYIDYITEIEELKEKHNLNAYEALMLELAAAFEVDNLNYEKLKKEFCK